MARNAPLIPAPVPAPAPYTRLSHSASAECVAALPPPPKLRLHNFCETRLADALAVILSRLCSTSTTNPPIFPDPQHPAALFFSPYKQKNFSLTYYCRRLLEYNCCSKSCLPVAILYLLRVADRFPIFKLNDYNVHRLLCTALVLAAKWLDDVSYSNAHYAKVGGIQTAAEMTRLEEHMLKALDYRLFVSKESFEDVENHIIQIASNTN